MGLLTCAVESQNFAHKVVQIRELVDITEARHVASAVHACDLISQTLLAVRSA
jgi:hypothetical protein